MCCSECCETGICEYHRRMTNNESAVCISSDMVNKFELSSSLTGSLSTKLTAIFQDQVRCFSCSLTNNQDFSKK